PYYFVQVRSGLVDVFEEGPLYRRGWVLQERMLPARLLHCGKTQLTWQCRETVASESYPKGRLEDGASYYRQVLWQLMAKPNAANEVVQAYGVRNDSTAAAANLLQRLWRGLVELYSDCLLTKLGEHVTGI